MSSNPVKISRQILTASCHATDPHCMLGMGLIRFGLKMTVFVIGARWIYAEAALVAPSTLPFIDAALNKVAIPTHDTWGEHYETAREFAHNFSQEHPELFEKLPTSLAEVKSAPPTLPATPRMQQIAESANDSLRRASIELQHTGS